MWGRSTKQRKAQGRRNQEYKRVKAERLRRAAAEAGRRNSRSKPPWHPIKFIKARGA